MKRYFKNILCVLILLCISSSLLAQRKKITVRNSSTVDGIENVLVYKFFFPDSELSWSKIFTTKNKSDINILYGETKSPNVINLLHSYRNNHAWETTSKIIDFDNNYKLIGGAFPTIYGKTKYPLYLFYGDSVLNYSILSDNRMEWINNRKLSVMLGTENSIIGVVSGSANHSSILLNSVNDRHENSVINAMSEDNGFNWELPSIAVKHNLVELKGWCIASKYRIPGSMYMILTDKDNQPYYSHSGTGGKSWSYPKKISSILMGDNYKMSIDNGYVVIFFRCIANADVNKSLVDNQHDIMLWHGTLAEFVSGNNKHGNLVKIIDNSTDSQAMNYSVEDISYYKDKRYYVLIKNYSDNNTSLQLHLIKRN